MKIERWPLWGLVALLGLGTIAAWFGGCSSSSMSQPGMTSGTGGATSVATGGSAGTTTSATGGATNTGGAPGPGGSSGLGGAGGSAVGGGAGAGLRPELVATFYGDNGPFDMIVGPDQNLWLEYRYCGVMDRLSPTGEKLPSYVLPTAAAPVSCPFVLGPDGKVWVGRGGVITRIAPSGEVVEFPLAGGAEANAQEGIAAGPDGNIWFTERKRDYIGRITPAGVVTEFPVPGTDPAAIVAGPDGNLWFREAATNKIGRLTPAGTITEFALPAADTGFGGITVGPDGALWFAEVGHKAIGRITTEGVVTEFFDVLPWGAITTGPDGNLWFTETYEPTGMLGPPRIGRITPAGAVSHVPLQFGDALKAFQATAVLVGPGGKIWFAANDAGLSGIGRILGDY